MMRVGIGYDVHPLVEERSLVLGGVKVAFKSGLHGHSDADVLSHATIDALLGAAAMKDIGAHFPDTDPRYKDISSITLLQRVGVMLRDGGFTIENIDATIICEQPRLAEYVDEMRLNMTTALGIGIEQVSVKATTSAGIGFLGEGRGIATYAVALVTKQ
jgi:2-C-methyl-D-erythritol 2,4-cyclodiphosphate synthase